MRNSEKNDHFFCKRKNNTQQNVFLKNGHHSDIFIYDFSIELIAFTMMLFKFIFMFRWQSGNGIKNMIFQECTPSFVFFSLAEKPIYFLCSEFYKIMNFTNFSTEF